MLLLLACSLVPLKLVKVKMLPFDNKSEFQVIIDMPNGTTLEQTTRVAQELGQYLGQQPEVVNYQIYAGTSGPYNFNGLVRHYFLRAEPNQADIQVNLLTAHERSAQSHDIAKRLRPGLDRDRRPLRRADEGGGSSAGPPVLETLVAEVYGPDYKQQIELARQIKQIFQTTPGVVDVDWYVEDPQTEVRREGRSGQGCAARRLCRGCEPDAADRAGRRECRPAARRRNRAKTFPIRVQLGRADRSSLDALDIACELPARRTARRCRSRELTDTSRRRPSRPASTTRT